MSWFARLVHRSGRASWLCWLVGHPEALHEITEHGVSWVCPECRRGHVSRVLRGFRRRELL